MNYSFELLNSRKLLKEVSYKVSGGMALYDMKLKKAILWDEFSGQELKYQNFDSSKLASQLASYIYRLPLETLRSMKSKVEKIPDSFKSKKIQVHNVENYSDIIKLKKLFTIHGLSAMANITEESMTKGSIILGIEFQGQEERLKSMIFGLSAKRLDQNKKIAFPFVDNPYYILLSSVSGSMSKYEKEILEQGKRSK